MKKSILVIYAILFAISINAQIKYSNNEVSGSASAIGEYNISTGATSFVSGSNSVATGDQSTALGLEVEANGTGSSSFGAFNIADGHLSAVLGSRSTAIGTGAIAIGNKVDALASYSYVIGYGLSDHHLENNINNSLMIGFRSDIPTFFVKESSGQGTIGKIGIGTTDPKSLLDVAGTLNVNDAATFGNSLSVSGQTSTLQLQITQGAGIDKILSSDASGLASWIDPLTLNVDDGDWIFNGNDMYNANSGNVGIGTDIPQEKLHVIGNEIVTGNLDAATFTGDGSGLTNVDDDDWVDNGNNVYRQYGNVGIGTNVPLTRLFIEDNTQNTDAEFLKISNENTGAGGAISLGKWGGNGPLILQKGGNVPFTNNHNYPRLSFIQRVTNGDDGLVISTFADSLGAVMHSEIRAPNSELYILSQNDIVFGTDFGESELVYFKQNGNVGIGTDEPSARLEVAGDIKATGKVLSDYIETDEILCKGPLNVEGKIEANEIEVKDMKAWKDEVFDKDYNLPSLCNVEQYINENGHLKDIPSEAEVIENGYNMGEMDAMLLQKVEELTLYVIELEKMINSNSKVPKK